MICSECNKELSTEELNKKIRCDECKVILCQNCSSLSGTEIRVMQLVGKRYLSFTCEKCKNKFIKNAEYINEEFNKKFDELKNHFSKNLSSLKQHLESTISVLQNEVINLRESNIELIHLLNVKCSNSYINPKTPGNITTKEIVKPAKPVERKANKQNSSNQSDGVDALLVDQTVQKPSYSKITASQVKEALDHAVHINSTNNESFQTVRYKKPNRKQNVMRGTAIVPEGELFISVPRKMWLYIGKVNKGVTTDIVRAFIKTKAAINNDEYLVVEQLKTIGELNAFKIGVNVQFYDKLNSSEFWPDGTIFRRFNFKRKSVNLLVQQNWEHKTESHSNSKLKSSTLNDVNNLCITSSQRDLPRNFPENHQVTHQT